MVAKKVIISTNAFGMGIDKADVRVVAHMEMPDSLEAYFQEVPKGRRDGKKSYAVLLYNDTDRINLERQFETVIPGAERSGAFIGRWAVISSWQWARRRAGFRLRDCRICPQFPGNIVLSYNCLKILEQAGWIVLTDAVFRPLPAS